jgi:uncharacterized membrane protein
MSRAVASTELPGTVHEAERCWYDTARWPAWIEGLEHVDHVDPGYPETGAEVRWRSGPAGRGQVRERVLAHEALGFQRVAVADDSIDGEQEVRFIVAGEGRVCVELTLEYRIRARNLLTPVVDRLFIRPAMRHSLESTLHRFGVTLAEERAPGRRRT